LTHQPDVPEAILNLEAALARGDKDGALNQMGVLARLGHAVSSSSVAQLYELGNEVIKSSAELAFDWYKRSAFEEIDSEGYFGLGRFYFDGRFVERDPIRALELFQQAASLGSTEAHVMIGFSYLGANGAPRDLAQAESNLLIAAEAGYVAAFYLLARTAFAQRRYIAAARYWWKTIAEARRLTVKDPSDARLYLLHGLWKIWA
jgi:TPR repeat protein